MIKLCIKGVCDFYSNNHLRCLLRLEPHLRNEGISFSGHNPDVMLIQCNDDIDYLLDKNIPTIIQDLYLGPELYWHGIREHMMRDNVKIVLKTSAFTDPKSYDIKYHSDQKHIAIIGDHPKTETYYTQVIDACHKIHVFASLVAWNYWDGFRVNAWEQPDFDKERPFDLCNLLGNIDIENYPIKESRDHRMKSVVQTHRLKNKTIIRSNHTPYLDRFQYVQALIDSKICLSPWGFDITCLRDYEAALCGSYVIRPDTSFAYTWPIMGYEVCAVDFSDLQAVVNNIVDNYKDFKEKRIEAYFSAKCGMDDAILARRLSSVIRKCLDA